MLGRISCRCTVLLNQMIFTEQTQKSTKITYKQHAQKSICEILQHIFLYKQHDIAVQTAEILCFCCCCCCCFFHLLHETCPYSEFSGSYFPAFGPNTEIYSVPLRIQSKCGKIRTRKTPSKYGHFLRSDPKLFFIRDVLRFLSSIVVNPLKPSVH